MFYHNASRHVFSAVLDPALPTNDSVYTGIAIEAAEAKYRPAGSNISTLTLLNYPVRFDFHCCSDNSPIAPLLSAFEAQDPAVLAAFPEGQFHRAVPDNLVGDICEDYIGNFHVETRLCAPHHSRTRCIFMVDDLVTSDVSLEREWEIYRAKEDWEVKQLVCNPQANVIAWTTRHRDALTLTATNSAGDHPSSSLNNGNLLTRCGCRLSHDVVLGSAAVSVDYAGVEKEGEGAIIFVDSQARLWRVYGDLNHRCYCEPVGFQIPSDASRLLRLSADWHYYYWLLNVSHSAAPYVTRLQFIPRDLEGEVETISGMLISSKMMSVHSARSLDILAFRSVPGVGFLNLEAGEDFQYRDMDLSQIFDFKAMAPEMRDVGRAKVPSSAHLSVRMTSESTAQANFTLTWEGNSKSAIIINYYLFELSADRERHCLRGSEADAECSLPPYTKKWKTEFRGSSHTMPLEGLTPGKRYMLDARGSQLIRLLGQDREFPFANASFVADYRDPLPATLAGILVPLILLLLALAAALAWRSRTRWRLRNVPRVPKSQLVWTQDDKLGSGHFAEVFKGRRGSQVVALKVQRPSAKAPEKGHFLQEAIIMSGLKHPNVTRILGISLDAHPYIIVLEFINGASLSSFLSANGQELTYNTLLKISTDCARGCAYVTSKCYIHRDISAKNFLVETAGGKFRRCKITDFGLAVDVGEGLAPYTTEMPEFPIRHAAPECFRGTFSVASDVYSLGIVLWEIVSLGRVPWAEFSNPRELEYWRRLRRLATLPQPRLCPHNLFQLMLSCWEEEPEKRPMMSEVVKSLETLTHLSSSSESQPLLPADEEPYSHLSTDSGRDTGEEMELTQLSTLPPDCPSPPQSESDDYAASLHPPSLPNTDYASSINLHPHFNH